MPFITLRYRDRQGSKANSYRSVNTGSSRPRRSLVSVDVPRARPAQNDPALGEKRQSIKLTVKVAPSKLREVMRANEVESLQDTLGGGKVIDGPRATRRATQAKTGNPRQARHLRYQEYAESDLDAEEEDEEEDGAPDETTLNDFDEIGAEAEGGTDEEEDDEEEEEDEEEENEEEVEEEDEDEEGNEEEDEEEEDEDVEMEDAPPPLKKSLPQPKPPKITLKTPAKGESRNSGRPKVIVTPANVGPLKSVEDQEMEDDPDDDEVDDSSELSENGRNDTTNNLNDEEMEGDEEMGEDGDEDDLDEDDEDELGDSGDETLASGQATPDPSRMTQRQRGRPGEALMALDMAPQQRKFFTDAEKAMKKDEHARKRKELTKRKTQEEKTAALNRLLKPQVSKSRGAAPKADTLAAQIQAAVEEEEIDVKADALYTRWINTKDGTRLGVPEEWLGKYVGKYFGPPLPPSNGALVQEVE